MSFIDHFSTKSKDYARYRQQYPAVLAQYLAGLCKSRELAWDCACGNGQLSVPLAAEFSQVRATDASRQQLASAAPHPRIAYSNAKAEASGLPDHCADLVASAQAVHWFNLPGFYAEVRRVGKAEGVLALVAYPGTHLEPELDAGFQHFSLETLAPYWPPERAPVLAGYKSLPFPFREIETPDFTMEAMWSFEQLYGFADTWSPMRALEKIDRRDIADDYFKQLQKEWGDKKRKVTWPLKVRAGYLS